MRKFIPDIDERIDLKMLGTPITHKKFTNAIAVVTARIICGKVFSQAAKLSEKFIYLRRKYISGIGIPAVSASGAYAAEKLLVKSLSSS